MNTRQIDQLFYPIMMQIRQLSIYMQNEEANKIILECQIKVETFILSIIVFFLDYVVTGPNNVTLSFKNQNSELRKELQFKVDTISHFLQESDIVQLTNNIQSYYQEKEGFAESEESEDEGSSLQIKLTGKIKEFNPDIISLKQQLEEKEALISQLKQKLKHRQNSLEILTHNHHKEVSVLKVQMQNQPEQESILDIKYFEETQMLDPEIIKMMNDKIKDLKNQYEKYLRIYIDKLQKQQLPLSPTPESPKQLNLNDYSSKELLKVALQKENNPHFIFKTIQDIKSIDFILIALSDQNPKTGIDYEKINKVFKANNKDLRKLAETRTLIEDCQAQLSAKYLVESNLQKQQIISLTNQIIEINNQQQQLLVEYTNKIENKQVKDIFIFYENQLMEINNELNEIQNQKEVIKNENIKLKQQHQQLIDNLKHLFNLVYPKYKTQINIDKVDFLKDKSTIIKDILYKVQHLEGFDLITITQEIQFFLYQIEQSQIINQIIKGKQQNKYTQTQICKISEINQPFIEQKKTIIYEKKEQKQILKHLEQMKQEQKRISNLHSVGVQTELLTKNNSSNDVLKTYSPETNQYSLNVIQLKSKQSYSIPTNKRYYRDITPEPSYEKQNSIFEKLYLQSQPQNPRWKMLKPIVNKLNEEEFQEVLNTLGLYSNRQQITVNSQIDVPLYDISKLQQSIICKGNKNKLKNNQLDNNIFEQLDEQREHALKLFEQQRIDTYRRRIKRLVPAQPSQSLCLEDKLRPKSQIRCSKQ